MRLKKRFAGVVSVVGAFAIVFGRLPIIGRPPEVYAESANKSIACLKYNGNPVLFGLWDDSALYV